MWFLKWKYSTPSITSWIQCTREIFLIMKMLTCVEFITLESMHVASTNKDQNFAPAIPVGKSIYERYTVEKALYNPNLRCYRLQSKHGESTFITGERVWSFVYLSQNWHNSAKCRSNQAILFQENLTLLSFNLMSPERIYHLPLFYMEDVITLHTQLELLHLTGQETWTH